MVSRATAPEIAERAPRRATSATVGRVASSRATSHEPTSRAPATAVAPAVAARTRLTMTAVPPGDCFLSSGQLSSRVTAAASSAASCRAEATESATYMHWPPPGRHSVWRASPATMPKPATVATAPTTRLASAIT